jgi:hypothetical protein
MHTSAIADIQSLVLTSPCFTRLPRNCISRQTMQLITWPK